MSESSLNITKIDDDFVSKSKNISASSRRTREKEMQAKFERLWLLDPEQFNPLRNCMQTERLERTWHLLATFVDPNDKQIADIGCAIGIFTRRLRDAGAKLTAVDIAENALKHVRKHDCTNIEIKQGTMPNTSLVDNNFDVVVCTEVIAELPPEDYRLFFSELARLVKPEGYVLCSTPIDIYSDSGVQRLVDLAHTEFNILSGLASYHALHLRIKHICEKPEEWVKRWKNPDTRKKDLDARSRINKWWYKINTTFPMMCVWKTLEFAANPLLSLLKNNRRVLLGLEKICRFFWDEAGISHFIFIAQRRPLQMPKPKDTPIPRPKKHEIWE